MNKSFKKYYLALLLAGIALCLLAMNTLSRIMGSRMVWDLTENKKYSLSKFSCEQTQKLIQPLYVTIYYSADMAQENPVYAKYAEYVIRFIQQYQQCNQDKMFIALKNPKPYSDIESEAQKEGIAPIPSLTGQTNSYFGVLFSDADGKKEVIPDFSMDRDFWLEKDITAVLTKFNETKHKTVGLISPIHRIIKRTYGQEIERYAFLDELAARYNLVELPMNISDIPESIDTLIVVAPTKMPISLMFALDQYVLRGGKVIMLLDAYVEEPEYKLTYDHLKEINSLLKNWGVEIADTLVGAQQYGQKEFVGDSQNGWYQTPYPLWMNLPKSAIIPIEGISSEIKNIQLRSASEIKELDHDKDFTVTPILKLEKGGAYDLFDNFRDKQNIVKNYKEEQREFTLGALIKGKFHSAFANIPQAVTFKEHNYLFYSNQPAQILLIGDSDLIRDNVWLNGMDLNDNGQLILKTVEMFNNEPEMAALYKSQTKMTQESLGSTIYSKIAGKYLSEISQLQNELQQLTEEHNNIRVLIEQKLETFNAMTALRDSEIREQIEELQNKLQYYSYKIKNTFTSKTQRIIFINLLVFPFLILVAWIGVYSLISRRSLNKIREKFNVDK